MRCKFLGGNTLLGKVKWFNDKKEVSFDVEEGPKGPQATNVVSQ
ncbi:MAG: cold-shock protein [Leptotrichia sp.]|nr:MAG: cold-shock protein [Leptotrichia sp.]